MTQNELYCCNSSSIECIIVAQEKEMYWISDNCLITLDFVNGFFVQILSLYTSFIYSYFDISAACLLGKQGNVRWRALTEEHARDSFENLLFSVCRFRELTGSYPRNITVSILTVGFPCLL